MNKILIIKLGALGDVLRTTPLLHVLKGDVTWVTQRNAIPLLKGNPLIRRVIDVKQQPESLKKDSFDLVLNLDEDPLACRLASNAIKKELIGAYEQSGKPVYTNSSAEWFDISLISRFGKKSADRKKEKNKKSYQEMIFKMIGKKFKNQEYILPAQYSDKSKKSFTVKKKCVGIEDRSGERWIGKRWSRFNEFLQMLNNENIPFIKFRQKPSLGEFIGDVDKTDPVITTDTLTLHIACALRKKIIALFTCTSPTEIYGYGRMAKIVSPLLHRYYYSTDPSMKSGEAIHPKTVLKAMKSLLFNSYPGKFIR